MHLHARKNPTRNRTIFVQMILYRNFPNFLFDFYFIFHDFCEMFVHTRKIVSQTCRKLRSSDQHDTHVFYGKISKSYVDKQHCTKERSKLLLSQKLTAKKNTVKSTLNAPKHLCAIFMISFASFFYCRLQQSTKLNLLVHFLEQRNYFFLYFFVDFFRRIFNFKNDERKTIIDVE